MRQFGDDAFELTGRDLARAAAAMGVAREALHLVDRSLVGGGVSVLVVGAVFKTVERQPLSLVGSIPIRLRHLRTLPGTTRVGDCVGGLGDLRVPFKCHTSPDDVAADDPGVDLRPLIVTDGCTASACGRVVTATDEVWFDPLGRSRCRQRRTTTWFATKRLTRLFQTNATNSVIR